MNNDRFETSEGNEREAGLDDAVSEHFAGSVAAILSSVDNQCVEAFIATVVDNIDWNIAS